MAPGSARCGQLAVLAIAEQPEAGRPGAADRRAERTALAQAAQGLVEIGTQRQRGRLEVVLERGGEPVRTAGG